jgi:hypothetical protein
VRLSNVGASGGEQRRVIVMLSHPGAVCEHLP